ncbi:glycoside hydrolase family 18 protein [Paenibacillus sp. UNC451MF]|uniref:glycoside hydrolase family 18 protein n=1 Tax=Paenibacillus sp. UNC451MF TaxID=1449063 RepID=UPI0004917FDC|nr:glycoside hydrolase family 18 protein [Paenibacillus sp. UNC451MF]
MFIYIVQPGDSLYTISVKYDIPIDRIRLANGLVRINIVPGQALLIPLSIYKVQPGDSIYTIAQMAYVPLQALINANPSIRPNALYPGMKITIPNISDFYITTLGYYALRSPELDRALVNDFAPYATFISLFEFHFSADGSLNVLDDTAAIQTAWSRRVNPLATITNLTQTGFSTDLTHQVLNNPDARNTLIENIYTIVSTKGYAGVNIDFERVSAEDRDLFSGFLRRLKERLQPEGYWLTIAVPAKTSDDIPWLLGYDYGAIGSVVDLMFIMTYDWHHGTSEAGPVAPINEVRRTIDYALQYVRRDKLLIGLPFYGYNWIVPYQPGSVAQALSNQNAVDLAMRYQVPIQYSQQYKSPFFEYVDENGLRHVVWFEDSRSISEKMLLIREYLLEGLGAWQLTLGFPEGPWLLTKFFRVKRV